VVGHIHDLSDFADCPLSPESWEKYVASAEALHMVVEGTLCTQDVAGAEDCSFPEEDDQLANDHQWGPKTTVLPEDPLLGNVASLVNLGPNVPNDIKPPLVEVL
jgi:hypothetical protein